MAGPVRLGIIGLGRMGAAMARRLNDCGHAPLLFNRTAARAAELEREGVGRAAGSVADVVAASDLIVCVVAGDDAARAVFSAPVLAAYPGRTVVNMGTIAASTAVELGAQLEAQGAAFLDAPVSGPPAYARRGELTILASGETAALRSADPVLQMLGSTVIHVGECGAGSSLKAILNRTARTFITALAAAIDEGTAAGFDADVTYDVLRNSMMASRVLEERRDLVMAARAQPPRASRGHPDERGHRTAP